MAPWWGQFEMGIYPRGHRLDLPGSNGDHFHICTQEAFVLRTNTGMNITHGA
jgi:hypothetical protein